MRSRFALGAVAAMVVLAVTAACSPSPDASSEPVGNVTPGGTLVAGASAEPPTVDPIMETALPSMLIIRPMYDTLIRFTPELDYEPQLATEWTVADDRQSVTFTLRDGVKFHSGKELTADDVLYSFDRLRSKESLHAALYSAVTDISADDDRTVTFTLDSPAPEALLSILAVAPSMIMDKDVVESSGDLKRADAGTGPFMFDTWQQGDSITLKKNPDYWADDQPYLDAVKFTFFADEGSAAAALRAGEIQWFQFTDPLAAEQLQGDRSVTYSAVPSLAYTYVSFNTTRAPFDDANARLGVSQALDRQAIVDVALGDTGEVSGPLTPAQSLALPFDRYPTYTQNVDEAKRLLAEGGIAEDTTLALTVSSADKDSMAAAPVIVDQLAKVGIKVKIESVEAGVWFERLSKHQYDLILGYSGGYPNPDIPFYNGFTCEGGWNWSGVCDAELEKLILEARAAQGDERVAAYEKVQLRFVNEVSPYAFLFAKKSLWGWSSTVHGFEPLPLMERRFETTWIQQ